MSRKEAYVEKTERELHRLNKEIDELATRVERAGGSVRIGDLQRIQTLRLKEAELQTKLDQLKATADEIWAGAKVGVDRVKSELREALHSAREQVG